MDVELDPPYGVGPLRLGMTVDEARAALGTLGPLRAGHGLAVDLSTGLGFSVGFGAAGLVNAVSVWRPDEGDTVRFRGVDVFGLPAREVARQLGQIIDLRPNEDDDSFTAPEVYLALWRSFADEDAPGNYFESVLVARPGYDDTPAQAAARAAAGGPPGY